MAYSAQRLSQDFLFKPNLKLSRNALVVAATNDQSKGKVGGDVPQPVLEYELAEHGQLPSSCSQELLQLVQPEKPDISKLAFPSSQVPRHRKQVLATVTWNFSVNMAIWKIEIQR